MLSLGHVCTAAPSARWMLQVIPMMLPWHLMQPNQQLLLKLCNWQIVWCISAVSALADRVATRTGALVKGITVFGKLPAVS